MAILLVEDQSDLAGLLRLLLERAGYEVVVATDPCDALEAFDDRIDGVISDIHMPGINGVELAQMLRHRRPEVPIVFATGSSPEEKLVRDAALLGPVCDKLGAVEGIGAELARRRGGG